MENTIGKLGSHTMNVLTIDVEDYFMVTAFVDVVKFEDWPKYESRVRPQTLKILELLDEYDQKATFFVLGWVAERDPELIERIHSRGHEIACHGYNHKVIFDLIPGDFREDVRKAKRILEDITGTRILGYRAPSFSVVKKNLWALDILREEGFRYDSSIFPIYHDRYGFPEAERFAHNIERRNGSIFEFPLTTYQVFGQNIPIAGGGYLRLFPWWLTKAAITRINKKENKPVVLYFHPWEIDPNQPRLNGRWLSRKRHYFNLQSTLPKLKSLLSDFEFKPMSEFLSSVDS